MDWLEGSSFFIRRQCFEQIGGFDPIYFMYWEDAEYCRRARYFGWRVCIVPGSLCRHFAGGSSAYLGPGVNQLANHFLYALTDPNRGFAKNCVVAIRLGVTYSKKVIFDYSNSSGFAKLGTSLCRVSMQLEACYSSWKNVRYAKSQLTRKCQ